MTREFDLVIGVDTLRLVSVWGADPAAGSAMWVARVAAGAWGNRHHRRNLPIPRRRPHGFQQFGSCRVLSPEKPDSSCGIHDSAEAVLKLQAVRANGDFDDYWTFHLNHERQRIHEARYADGILPLAA